MSWIWVHNPSIRKIASRRHYLSGTPFVTTSSHMLVPFLAAESAAHWLQGEGRDRGKDRGGRDKRWRDVSAAGRRNFKFAFENTRKIN